ncbi:MAG: SDR family oxidoreductase [Kiloniellales bacterium]
MNVIVFGATGSVGRHLVAQALQQDHRVTAFARHADSLEIQHDKLIKIAGDVLNAAAVEAALAGQDAAMITLGAGRKGGVRAEGTRNIIAAMQRHGPSRLICQSTLGAGDSRQQLNFFWKRIMFGLLLRPAYLDHQLQEALVRESGLDWTIVRPAAFTDGPLSASYQAGFPPSVRGLTLKISRADVADFMLRQLRDGRYLHQTPGLSY